ncbi:MAG: hypothetical protein LN569_04220 [Rickettsia endosymbiont of Labidopullus appendiculatus]|nr:hypothetical protein [Rickettsia endosymbiont of Labidopullus appendiculatus]
MPRSHTFARNDDVNRISYIYNITDFFVPLIAVFIIFIFSIIDFLHKSKIVEGFLGETKPSTAAYIDVR